MSLTCKSCLYFATRINSALITIHECDWNPINPESDPVRCLHFTYLPGSDEAEDDQDTG